MGVASKLGKMVTKSKKLQSLEKEYGRKAQAGETAREFQSRMNQLDLEDEMSSAAPKGGKGSSLIDMLRPLSMKQRRAEIRELQASGVQVPKRALDLAGMKRVGDKLVVKDFMMGGGAAMKKKMMMGGGASMKKKAYAKGGANMKKKSYAAGGASMKKKMMAGGGAMKKKSYAVGGMVRANAGASVPASGGSRNK